MEIAPLKIVIEKDLSVNDLLERLANPASNSEERILAEKFRVIFFDDFWKLCKIACKNQFGKRPDWEQITEDIFSSAIIIAFEELKNFKLPKDKSEYDSKKIVSVWLAKIANNKILEHRGVLKKEKENLESYKNFLKLNLDEGSIGTRDVTKSYDIDKMHIVWNNLCALSKDIILSSHTYDCFPYFDHVNREFQKNKKHLPKEIRKNIIEKHGTTDDNFRKVKQRAFEAIFSCTINPELVK